MLKALNFIAGGLSFRSIMPAGHALLNANVPALLAQGLITYGNKRDQAWKLTPKGKAMIANNGGK